MPKPKTNNSGSNIIGALFGIGLIIAIIVGGLYLLDAANDLESNATPTPEPTPAPLRVSVVIDNLPILEKGHYEMWLHSEDDQNQLSLGKFVTNADNELIDLAGTVFSDREFTVQQFEGTPSRVTVTIEPENDDDNVPSTSTILEAVLNNGIGALEFAAADFSTVTGNYILATPTDGPDTNETSGLWFVSKNGDSYTAGLNLPFAPDGWIYEGWIKIDDTVLSTGTFMQADAEDDSFVFSGTLAGFSFPGEDFLNQPPNGLAGQFPLDLSLGNVTTFVSFEPITKRATDPSLGLLILQTDIVSGSVPDINYALQNVYQQNFPSGLIVVR